MWSSAACWWVASAPRGARPAPISTGACASTAHASIRCRFCLLRTREGPTRRVRTSVDPESLSALLDTWGYPALLLLLILTGVGSPIPEDLLLLTAGYLVYTDVFYWPPALFVGVIG